MHSTNRIMITIMLAAVLVFTSAAFNAEGIHVYAGTDGQEITDHEKKARVLYFAEDEITGEITDGGCQLNVICEPAARITYTSGREYFATVDESGYVTFHNEGKTEITASIEGDDEYMPASVSVSVNIADSRKKQTIEGIWSAMFDFSETDKYVLEHTAPNPITYHLSPNSTASVDDNGVVTFYKPGMVTIKVRAAEGNGYRAAERLFYLRALSAEEAREQEEIERRQAEKIADELARQKAQEEAIDKAQEETNRWEAERDAAAAASSGSKAPVVKHKSSKSGAASGKKVSNRTKAKKKAKALKRPKLRSKRGKGRVKLTWSKVKGASGYIIYVKYPGSKRYEKALVKSAKIKSVTHSRLTKGRTYRYKVRPYVKIGKAKAYGKYSKAIKVKVR